MSDQSEKLNLEKQPSVLKLSDIAKQAGVSIATVSRVLSNPELVREKTLKKVQTTIEESGYFVNEMARGLRKKKTGVLMVMAPSISTAPFISQEVVAMKKAANRAGYIILIANYENTQSIHRQLFSYIYQNRADGIIFLGGNELFPKSDDAGFSGQIPPVVAVNERIRDAKIPSIATDAYSASLEIVQYLVGLGHKKLGHVSGPVSRVSSARDRWKGFMEGVRGLPDAWVFETEYNMESGVLAAGKWIALSDKPSAVFCSCDEVAFGFISELHRNGFRVPKDVSVVSFDNIPLAKYCIPPLTTFSQPHEEIGERAIQMLIRLINDESPQFEEVHLKGKLIIRESTHRYEGQ